MEQFTDWRDPRINPTQVLGDLRTVFQKMNLTIGSLEIVETSMAVTATGERLFPQSRNRSKRIHKKLVRRFGGEYALEPGIIAHGNTIYIHPLKIKEFKKEIESNKLQQV